jgi:hypothetical protein
MGNMYQNPMNQMNTPKNPSGEYNNSMGNPNMVPNMYYDPRMLFHTQMMYQYGMNNQQPQGMNYPMQQG